MIVYKYLSFPHHAPDTGSVELSFNWFTRLYYVIS